MLDMATATTRNILTCM